MLAPDHWFGLVDAAWRGTWPPPMWAVVGQWRSDDAGRLVEWQSNPEYHPSPSARGWSRPTDAIDAAVQRAASGYGGDNEVPVLVARADVAVYVRPDGELMTAVAPDGSAVVPVLTSQFQVDRAGRLAYEIHPVLDLMEMVPTGHALYLNPAAEVSMKLDLEALEQALAVVRGEAAVGDEVGEEQGTPADAADRDAGPSAEEADRQDDEPVVGATRIETSGSAPTPVVPQRAAADSDGSPQTPPGASDTDDAFGTGQRAAAEGVGGVSETPAAVSQATDHADSPAASLAEGAAAALMGASGR
ncbi:type VII secretion system-associated protein [Streptomyces sp. NPDC049687]|uniref:type VII secretion system-associated protein n=1 Tax=Streptomyces sp. NPDC049687 TaxID=3365596 RepID=UPI0037AE2B88